MRIKKIITCERDWRIRFALDGHLIRIKCTYERSINVRVNAALMYL
jgi:hypothetical protein